MKWSYGFASELKIPSDLIQKFYKDNWARKIALSDSKFYKWQFQSPPAHLGVDMCVTAAADNSVLGVMGLGV